MKITKEKLKLLIENYLNESFDISFDISKGIKQLNSHSGYKQLKKMLNSSGIASSILEPYMGDLKSDPLGYILKNFAYNIFPGKTVYIKSDGVSEFGGKKNPITSEHFPDSPGEWAIGIGDPIGNTKPYGFILIGVGEQTIEVDANPFAKGGTEVSMKPFLVVAEFIQQRKVILSKLGTYPPEKFKKNKKLPSLTSVISDPAGSYVSSLSDYDKAKMIEAQCQASLNRAIDSLNSKLLQEINKHESDFLTFIAALKFVEKENLIKVGTLSLDIVINKLSQEYLGKKVGAIASHHTENAYEYIKKAARDFLEHNLTIIKNILNKEITENPKILGKIGNQKNPVKQPPMSRKEKIKK